MGRRKINVNCGMSSVDVLIISNGKLINGYADANGDVIIADKIRTGKTTFTYKNCKFLKYSDNMKIFRKGLRLNVNPSKRVYDFER